MRKLVGIMVTTVILLSFSVFSSWAEGLSDSELRDVAPRLELSLHEAIDLYMNNEYSIDKLIDEMNRVSNGYLEEYYK